MTEAIQRIDPSSVSHKKSGLLNSNGCDNKFLSTNEFKNNSKNEARKSHQRQRHASSKKSRKSNKSSSTSAGFSPILPNVPEMDLYLNSAASNVSPDSGIQSEGNILT